MYEILRQAQQDILVNVRSLPDLCFLAGYHNALVTDSEYEVTLLDSPLTIIVHECKILCRNEELYSLGLTWLKFNLSESAEATDVWNRACIKVC